MNRREFLTTTSAGLTATALARALHPRTAYGQGSKEVVVCLWGGSFQDAARQAWFQPFEKETGIKVIDVFPADYGKLATMVATKNVEWDVLDVSASFVPVGIQKNLFERLDFSVIDKAGLMSDAVTDFTVPYIMWSTVLAYGTRRFSTTHHPASWTDFWDVKKFPGVRALRKISYATLEAALMADGVPRDKLYPLDVDRAFRSLERIKPHVKVWWSQGAQPIQLLTDGEVDMTSAWHSRLYAAKSEGARLDFVWDQGVLHSSSLAVPLGARNRENAMRLIAYILSPRVQARLTDYSPTGPANAKAYQYIKPEVARLLPTAEENRAKQVRLDEFNWWAKNFADVEKRFQEWVLR